MVLVIDGSSRTFTTSLATEAVRLTAGVGCLGDTDGLGWTGGLGWVGWDVEPPEQ